MECKYEKETKNYYKNDLRAELYHRTLVNGGKLNRHHIIANRERAIVGEFLQRVPHKTVLDLPAGTGKLAPVFKSAGSTVKACDISENMLSVARKVYSELQYEGAEFQVCDAAKAREKIKEHFDLAVCLRLLHRVPENVRVKILEELASLADYSIVSFGVHSTYHEFRRTIQKTFIKIEKKYACFEPFTAIVQKLEKNFEIIDYKWVLPLMSREIIFLLRPHGK